MKEPVCAEASTCNQLRSPFIRHQGTPSGVSWKSDFLQSLSHGLLVYADGFGAVGTEKGRLG